MTDAAMVEKVARAIYEAADEDESWEAAKASGWITDLECARAQARAAIAATGVEEMREALAELVYHCESCDGTGKTRIDARLNCPVCMRGRAALGTTREETK